MVVVGQLSALDTGDGRRESRPECIPNDGHVERRRHGVGHLGMRGVDVRRGRRDRNGIVGFVRTDNEYTEVLSGYLRMINAEIVKLSLV